MNFEYFKIRLHKELSLIEEKYLGFSFRQWITLILTALISLPLYFFFLPALGSELTSWIIMLIGTPILLVGFVRIQQMSFLHFVSLVIRHYFYFSEPLKPEGSNAPALKQSRQRKRIRKSRIQTGQKKKKSFLPSFFPGSRKSREVQIPPQPQYSASFYDPSSRQKKSDRFSAYTTEGINEAVEPVYLNRFQTKEDPEYNAFKPSNHQAFNQRTDQEQDFDSFSERSGQSIIQSAEKPDKNPFDQPQEYEKSPEFDVDEDNAPIQSIEIEKRIDQDWSAPRPLILTDPIQNPKPAKRSAIKPIVRKRQPERLLSNFKSARKTNKPMKSSASTLQKSFDQSLQRQTSRSEPLQSLLKKPDQPDSQNPGPAKAERTADLLQKLAKYRNQNR